MKSRTGFYSTLVAVLMIFIGVIIFHTTIKDFFGNLLLTYGFIGLFFSVWALDTLIQPISPDILVLGSTIGGASVWTVILIAGLASVVAGITGYLIGYKLGSERFEEWFGKKHLVKGEELFKKYGVWGIVIGAFSPIPYSSICWAAGVYKMNFNIFVITSLLTRVPRFFFISLISLLL